MAYLAARYPKTIWEIWNEPDGGVFLLPNGQTAQTALGGGYTFTLGQQYYANGYTPLVLSAYPLMKAADPTCTVLVCVQGTIPIWTPGTLDPFLSQCYVNGIIGNMDGYSCHPYSTTSLDAEVDPMVYFATIINPVQAIRTAAGDVTPFWITEYGYFSAYPDTLATAPGANMVLAVNQAAWHGSFLSSCAGRGDIAGVCIFTLADASATPGSGYANFTGITSDVGTATPPVLGSKQAVSMVQAVSAMLAGTNKKRFYTSNVIVNGAYTRYRTPS
jgi:hypothetical protein